MKDDPVRERILEELREVRRGRGPISMDRVASADWLVRDFGRGSVELCYSMLLEFRDRHGTDPESDVTAFYDTAGFTHANETLDQRLRAYADEHFVDPRTALRRSDRGADRLSYLIRDSYVGLRPWGHLAIMQSGPTAQFRIHVGLDDGLEWSPPAVTVNGREIDEANFVLNAESQRTGELTSLYTHAPEEMVRRPPIDNGVFWVHVRWRVAVWPSWSMSAVIADPRLYGRLTMTRNLSVAAAIDWAPGLDFDRDSPFAFEPVQPGLGAVTQDPRSDIS